ncbi:MAG: prenyltransferase [Nitrososphaeria archaeon]|nr:prenyltransferase [Nitrososphaeria archaeon]NIQ33029.1 prenyltransferase [Nitrososphaeria archaeon]
MGDITQRIRDHTSLLRPFNSFAIGIAVIVGEVVTLRGIPPPKEATLGFLTGFFISSSSMVFNDYFDVEADSMNIPKRPLPSKRISMKEALVAAFLWGIIGVFCSILLGPINTLIALLFWLIGVIYSWVGKATGLLGNLMVSVSVAIPYVFGGAAVGRPSDYVIITFFAVSLLANMGREVAKGIMDMKGDTIRSVKTVALQYGVEAASRLSALFLFTSVVLSWLPYIYGWLGIYYLAFVAVADVAIAYPAIKMILRGNHIKIRRIKTEILVGMFLGLIAFIVGGLTS